MKVLLGLLAVFALICLARASPEMFVGGPFLYGAHGVYSPGFIRYHYGQSASPEAGFERLDHPNGVHSLNDIATFPTRPGVFGVGSVQHFGHNFPSGTNDNGDARHLAHFDGQTWTTVKHGTNTAVDRVRCPTDNDCYIVGHFSSIQGYYHGHYAVGGIAHFAWSDAQNEWLFSNDLEDWSVFGEGTIPLPGGNINRFEIVNNGGELYFFVGMTNGNIYRGSRPDDGWRLVTSNIPNTAVDWSIAESSMYVLTNAQTLISPSNIFQDPTTISWTSFISNYNSDGAIATCSHIFAVSTTLRYLTCRTASITEYPFQHWFVYQQSGSDNPTKIGLPFSLSSSDPFQGLSVLDGNPLVWGSFSFVNWVEDSEDPSYNRPLDVSRRMATFDTAANEWVAPFGGGLDALPERIVRSAVDGSVYYYFLGSFNFGYDLVTNNVLWHDNDPSLVSSNRRPWFPLVHHAVRHRMTGGHVTDVVQRGGVAYVAGRFDYVGMDRRGSIFSTTPVRERAEFATQEVGGGLWRLDFSQNHNEEFLVGGTVRDLLFDSDGNLYAGGLFQRTSSGVCLSNIAVLQNSGGEWADIGGGCDADVNKMIFWRDNLYATGDFHTCGYRRVNYISGWIGGEWVSLGSGLDAPGVALAVYRDELVVAGSFHVAGGIKTWSVAAWNGASWRSLSNGCSDSNCALYPNINVDFVLHRTWALKVHPTNGRLYAVSRVLSDEKMLLGDTQFLATETGTDDGFGAHCHEVCVGYPYVSNGVLLVEYDGLRWNLLGVPHGDTNPFSHGLGFNRTHVLTGSISEESYFFTDARRYNAYDYVLKNYVRSHLNTDNPVTFINSASD